MTASSPPPADAGPPPSAGRSQPPATEPAPPGPLDEVAAQMLRVDARRVVLVGSALFGICFIALLPFWHWLGVHHHRVWLWTALSGAVLGLAALPLIRKHTGEGRLG